MHNENRMPTDPTCVFCRIVEGKAEASLLYRDDRVTAFMDTRPVNPGHALVIPNDHRPDLAGLDPVTGGAMFAVAQRLSAALRRSGVRCQGVNLYLADGLAAGQEVLHIHLHVVPRFVGDGFGLRRVHPPQHPHREDLDAIANQIRAALGGQPRP